MSITERQMREALCLLEERRPYARILLRIEQGCGVLFWANVGAHYEEKIVLKFDGRDSNDAITPAGKLIAQMVRAELDRIDAELVHLGVEIPEVRL